MTIFKFAISSFLFPLISFLVWGLMSYFNGRCPMNDADIFYNHSSYQIKFLLPLVALLQGFLFTIWFQKVKILKPNINPIAFGLFVFILTRFLGELYFFASIKGYSEFLVMFGLIHGLFSIIIWSVIVNKLLYNDNKY